MTIDPDDLAQLRDLECPECGPLVDDDGETCVMPWEVDGILADNVCPDPDCGAELEPTLEASLGMLQLIAERMPETREAIGKALDEFTAALEER